jgi:adenosylcobinamide-phosphate synthase
MWSITPSQLLIAILLDLLLGDPRGWPHIARMTGALAVFYERILTIRFARSVTLGVAFWLLVTGTMFAGYGALFFICRSVHLGWALNVFIVYQGIAVRDLTRHALAIWWPLRAEKLDEARAQLSQIVGRDTAALDEQEISRAAIESVAESTCDGIIAPLFWAAVAGAPGALLYRVANTLDSMVGHRDARYERFGKTSARLDDFLNLIPARLTALCYSCLNRFQHWEMTRREAAAHASPNAGWPEAAMAHVLDVRLGGANCYDGVPHHGPVFHPDGRPPHARDILRCLRAMWSATAIAVALLLTALILFRSR